jgi:hypothetical protein
MASFEIAPADGTKAANYQKSGEFGVSPFHVQLPTSKEPDGARRLHGSRNNAYGCFGSTSEVREGNREVRFTLRTDFIK